MLVFQNKNSITTITEYFPWLLLTQQVRKHKPVKLFELLTTKNQYLFIYYAQ